ncbi:membrane-bound lytic murein transglycosylase MltF [Pseudobowmanella zhangzhouensis]|uniref:Membrane-bound lytic murein transglycosylase F n=1 Tax=Pseudobowmanella zhangzhouensis TaxID=1537679 RepID=A0ABW1XMG3_9ALTE
MTSLLRGLLQRLALIFTCAVVLACQPQIKSNALQQVLQQGVLKVGTRYGPTTYYQGPEGPQGFEYELAAGFADYLGVKLEMLPYYNLDELYPQLDSRHVDLIATGLTVNADLHQRFKVGPAYNQVSQKLVFKQGRPWPRTADELDGEIKVVAVSSHASSLRQLQHNFPALQWTETNEQDEEELLQAVLDEDLSFTIADSHTLAVMRWRNPELAIAFTVEEEQPIAWLLSSHQDDSLLAALIDYFGQLRADGRLTALNDKYFGHIQSFDYVDTRRFIEAVEQTLPEYRELFRAESNNLDWRLLAAMSYQESHWNPKARSHTGVRGMMMLTLDTARDLGVKSRLDPRQSIQGGARYFQMQLDRIPERIAQPDRTWFALAAYNAGWGHVEDARILTQRQGGNPDLWVDVKQRLPLLRQKKYYKTLKYGYARGDEAAAYVANIRRYYDTLVWLDENQGIAPEQVPNQALEQD